MANEVAWRSLKPSLQCGQNVMKLKATGPGATDLQLDMGRIIQQKYTFAL